MFFKGWVHETSYDPSTPDIGLPRGCDKIRSRGVNEDIKSGR